MRSCMPEGLDSSLAIFLLGPGTEDQLYRRLDDGLLVVHDRVVHHADLRAAAPTAVLLRHPLPHPAGAPDELG